MFSVSYIVFEKEVKEFSITKETESLSQNNVIRFVPKNLFNEIYKTPFTLFSYPRRDSNPQSKDNESSVLPLCCLGMTQTYPKLRKLNFLPLVETFKLFLFKEFSFVFIVFKLS
jgi:hypothetical protein